MANISKRNRSKEREMENAAKNRHEIIKAGLSRRDMMKMGLLTSAGLLIPKMGLSARARNSAGVPTGWMASPPAAPFIQPFTTPPIAQTVAALSPAPQVVPNTAAGERRTRDHQALTTHPPVKLYEVHQRDEFLSVHPDYPLQRLWTFNGTVPGQTYVAHYGEPILVRNFNDLPDDNGGFGRQEVSTHLHNGHTPSESDGFPCDFYGQGLLYDQRYPNVLAGFYTTHSAPIGDIRESLSTLWYHDHRVDFTAQNVYKGLAGFYLLFNNFDTGNETTGFRLPELPGIRCPDDVHRQAISTPDRNSCLRPGEPRRHPGRPLPRQREDSAVLRRQAAPLPLPLARRRPFALLPVVLTNLDNTNNPSGDRQRRQFAALPCPASPASASLWPSAWTSSSTSRRSRREDQIYLDNRLQQYDGAGPTDNIVRRERREQAAGVPRGSDTVNDPSVNPATTITRTARHVIPYFYAVPARAQEITRCFDFDRDDGEWVINGQVCWGLRRCPLHREAQQRRRIWELEGGS